VPSFFTWFNNLYPVWLVALATVAFLRPETMRWFDAPWIFGALAASMLCMGLTLNPADFRDVRRNAGAVVFGFAAQYTVMPLTGWLVAKVLDLETGLAVGIMLVASCPGGMASNMITYLARANVALSIVLTLCSTVMAFVLVTGGIVAASAEAIATNFGRLALAATALHVVGFAVGYALPKIVGFPETIARTVSIEVGMQNGGMAAALAGELQRHFATNSVTLAPGPGRGNHLTWLATVDGRALFIRVENGPEADGHLAVESAVLERVRAAGVPTPPCTAPGRRMPTSIICGSTSTSRFLPGMA